jgi:DNA-binding transcriptional LysR family regulator
VNVPNPATATNELLFSPVQFDLIDIRLFVNVTEKKSVTQGAEHSYMSPPAASVRIKNIEERLGTKLLYRTSQGVSPTPAGEAFLRHGRLVLQQLESLRQDLMECVHGRKGRIRVLVSPGAFPGFPSVVLRDYISGHPDVSIELRETTVAEIARELSDGTADAGVIEGEFRLESLEMLPYRRERLMVVASRLHPLAARRVTSFSDTLEFDYVALAEASPLHDLLNQAAKRLQRPLNIRVQVSDFEALCRLVEANVGIGILPASAARCHARSMGLQIIELSDPWAIRDLRIAVRKRDELPAFVREFVDLFLSHGETASFS